MTLFWPLRMTDLTVLSCSINQKATSSWWNEAWWAGVWCHPATGGWQPGGLRSPLATEKAILRPSAAEVGARSCMLEAYGLYLLPAPDTHSFPAQHFNYAAVRERAFHTRTSCPDIFIFPRVGSTALPQAQTTPGEEMAVSEFHSRLPPGVSRPWRSDRSSFPASCWGSSAPREEETSLPSRGWSLKGKAEPRKGTFAAF